MQRVGRRRQVTWCVLVGLLCAAWLCGCRGSQGGGEAAQAQPRQEGQAQPGAGGGGHVAAQALSAPAVGGAQASDDGEEASAAPRAAAEAGALLVTTPAQLVWLDLLEGFYEARHYAPLLTDGQGLTVAGAALLQALGEAEAHALDPMRYHLPLIAAELEALQDAALEERPSPTRATLQPLMRPMDVLAARLWSAGANASGDVKPLRRWRLVQVEVMLTDALLSYAHDMRLSNLNDVADDLRAQQGDAYLIRQRLLALLDEAGKGGLEAKLPGLIPPWPQYARLLPVLQRYRALMADIEDWPRLDKLPKRAYPLTRGDQGPVLEQLQMRLTAEGFYQGQLTATLDKDTQEALKRYQVSHQLKDDGELDERTHASLNVPLPVRVAEVEVSLERWRQTLLRADEPYYIFVNIPDFHGELWRDGKLVHRFRVIVGATARYFSKERDETLYTQATPVMSQTLVNIIFNPTWTVPEDIRKNEHPALLAKDAKYYEKNGFDVIRSGNHVMVRQRPGPNNALGFVKFVFPNDHNIYMHDTPLRGMFRHPVRAFSHGCVRVDEPLVFAEVLMREDGEQRPKYIVERYMESGRTGDYTLKTTIPVHIDYIVVRVEDDGVVTFGTDIYRRDRPLIMRSLERMGLDAAQFFPDTAP
jgi:murein L,D-transpeptidase YcbB/YkuD